MLPVVVLRVVEEGLDTGLDEAPGTGVEGLLLTPDNGLGIGVHVKVLLELLPGEGVQLLNTGESNVVDLVVGTVLGKSSPNLSRAENDTLNLLGLLDGASLVLGIGDDPLELGFRASEVLNVGTSKRVAQERLREEDDQS